jgi:trimeric autotransporter adhesin
MREYWMGILAAAALTGLAAGPAAADEQRVGVAAAVNPDATGKQLTGKAGTLAVGADVMFKERISTTDQGQAQLLFVDQSALTVASNSEVVIDEFVFDPAKNTGKMAATMTKGLLRYVGGKLSKGSDVTFTTPSSVISIRGGIALINVGQDGSTDATFLYGEHVCVTVSTTTSCMTRPGFTISVNGVGKVPSAPVPAKNVGGALQRLSGQAGKSAGSSNPPSDQKVGATLVSALSSGSLTDLTPPNSILETAITNQRIWQKGTEQPPISVTGGPGGTHLPRSGPGKPPG